ncbi:MAG: AAA family ATPase [Caldilineaceae bacterium]|nr:AAA family ATPase [Caldilineaceae bacterium]
MLPTRFHFLGPVRLQRQDTPVNLTIAKAQALLACLALSGTPLSREQLIALLWPESHPEAARKNLRNTLWQIRRAFDDESLISGDETLTLSPAVGIDVIDFEAALTDALDRKDTSDAQLKNALSLRRGPLLQDLSLLGAPDFELRLESERRRLDRLYLLGLSRLMACQEEAADWAQLAETAQRVLAEDPTAEAACIALMKADMQLGRRSDALQEYDRLQRTLSEELGAAPSPEATALYRQILQADGTAEHTPVPQRPPIAADTPSTSAAPFIGRGAERLALDAARHAAEDGRLQIALISGELGMGKSYLWRRWSEGLPAGSVVLETRCLDSTRLLPFVPLTALFSARNCAQRIIGPESPISPVWLTELARLLPQIREHHPQLPESLPLPPEEEHRRIFEAFVQALLSLDAGPLILFIDDLHWADQTTLEWLVYLAERMRDEPLLLVGAYRADEASPLLRTICAEWDRGGRLARLPLEPLTTEESVELIAALHGDPASVDRLYARSRGNPYFLAELSRARPDGLPDALADLIRSRLHHLPEQARRLLQVAAILEPSISFRTLQAVSRQPEDVTLDALDTLLDRSILVEHDDALEFTHPLLADLVRRELSLARRRSLHLRVAEYLRESYGGGRQTIAGLLARHYAEADQPTEAARYAESAAQQAFQVGAVVEAANFYRQANELEPTPFRLLELGHVLMHLPGEAEAARAAMLAALAAYEETADQQGILQAGLRVAFSYLALGKGDQVLFWAERIQATLTEESTAEMKATLQYLMGAGKSYTPHALAEADIHFSVATRLAAEQGIVSDIAVQSWFGWGNLSLHQGDYGRALHQFSETRALARKSRNIYFEALSYNNFAHAAHLAGDLDDAHAAIREGLDFIERNQLMRPRQYLYSTQGELALALGDPDLAEWWLRAALDEAQIYNNLTQAANIRANLGRVALTRGDDQTAERELLAALASVVEISAPHLQTQIELWLADLYANRADPAESRRFLQSARTRLGQGERGALHTQAESIAGRLGALSESKPT